MAFQDVALKELHDHLLTHRNEVIAHSDDTVQPVILLPKGAKMMCEVNGEKCELTLAEHCDWVETPRLGLDRFPLFKSLCEFQLQRIKTHAASEMNIVFLHCIGVRVAKATITTLPDE